MSIDISPAGMAEHNRLNSIRINKELRVDIAFLIDRIKRRNIPLSPCMEHVVHYLKNARHWLGEDLAVLGETKPYPNGDDVTNTIVDPATDMVKP